MQAISFYIVWSLIWIISFLPFRMLYVISDGMYLIIYYLVKYRRNVVYQNLKNSFPDKSENEIETITKKFYHQFCDLLIETIKLMHLSKKEILRRVIFKNPEIFDHFYNQEKSVLCAAGHYGNWEATYHVGLFTKLLPLPIYKPLNNKYFDKFLYKSRSKYRAVPVPMNAVLKKFVQYKNEKVYTLSAFVSDQTPLKNDIQYWTTFLNQDTPIYLGIEKIAKKFNYPVVYLTMNKPKRGYYDIYVEVLCEDPSKSPEFEITEKHVRALERDIIAKPELWLWSHRRWKHKKDKIEA